jgi:hypothetical protein
MATELRALNDPPRIARAILEDRWEGLKDTRDGMDTSKIYLRLIETLDAFVEGVSRHPYNDDAGRGEVDLIDECTELLREHIIRRVDELELAR